MAEACLGKCRQLLQEAQSILQLQWQVLHLWPAGPKETEIGSSNKYKKHDVKQRHTKMQIGA